jgi:hypothetical protein
MPIADVELVMMASAAVLAAQHFPRKVDEWEGLPAFDRTWRAWKVAFHLAHLKRQRQLQASEPLRGAHSFLPAPAASIDRLGTALDNFALAAANDTTVLQQLTSANLALTMSNATLTAANKKLLEALAKVPTTTPGTPQSPWPPTVPLELFLDSWPSYQSVSHKCIMRQQGRGAQGRGNGLQHDGR